MKSNDVIVAGGRNSWGGLSSVEVLNRRTLKWKRGPQLPMAISYASMVADPDGGVILVGGQSGGNILDTLYRLSTGLG